MRLFPKEFEACPDCKNSETVMYERSTPLYTAEGLVVQGNVRCYCFRCGFTTAWYKTVQEAEDAWNRATL